ncbi:MAG: hypothetical protein L0Z50_05030 [Verrucomicrobiales bacterium]|nr:hypothetical protein [Verrucomicrobiales bacterium]
MRSGKVRILFGSTQKMGSGTNVQERLIALHHLDARPGVPPMSSSVKAASSAKATEMP